jgi:hypothetical protein
MAPRWVLRKETWTGYEKESRSETQWAVWWDNGRAAGWAARRESQRVHWKVEQTEHRTMELQWESQSDRTLEKLKELQSEH